MEINVEGNGAGPVAARMQAEKLVNSRRIEAPPALVYEAWTSLPHLKRWWNPAGFTWVRATLRLRPGGVFHYCLRSLNGEAMWAKLTYRELDAPRRLEFLTSFSNERQQAVRAPFSSTWPLEMFTTVDISEARGGTEVTLSGSPWQATEEERRTFVEWHDALRQGFADKLDQLEEYVVRAAREQDRIAREGPRRRTRSPRHALRY